MVRLRVMQGAIALMSLALPIGTVAASGDSEPDDSVPETTGGEDSGPPSASAPADTQADGGDALPDVDIEFQVDMMLGLVPQAEMEEHDRELEQDAQAAIQACMNEAGFDYELEFYPRPSGEDDPYSAYGTLEFAEQYGFGTWTMMDPETNSMMSMSYESPNQAMLENMSEQEINAYYQVNGRCSEDAYRAQYGVWDNPDVQQIMDDFYTDVENDPRLRDAQAAWVDCMEAAGFPFADQEAMYSDINAGDDEYTLHDQFYESEAWDPASEDHAQLQDLVDHEIEVAVANAGCEPAVNDVREEVQQDLREDLLTVWQTIDWSLPPVTYEGMDDVYLMPGETLPEGTTDEGAGETTEANSGDDTEATDATDEPAVGLDLGGDPTETTEP